MVYVLNIKGHPIMPTENYAKVRVLLKQGKAKVVKRCPFTIQLLYETTNFVQPISLGVDSGSKHVGISATTKKKVLYESDIKLRGNIMELLSTRKEYRKNRRNRKTRYRKARFLNRRRKDGWLPPSIKEKIETHITIVCNAHKILPISNIVIEVAQFDIHKIKNPDVQGEEYQQGEQFGFLNAREYVLWRDNHICQNCKGKSKDKILNVHHIESRRIGGNAPNNLITLCKTCHQKFHNGEIQLDKSIKRGMKFKDATFMGIMRYAFYNQVKELYSNVNITYGFITKKTRIQNNLPKAHYIDARCISGNPSAKSDGIIFYQEKVRCHNRKIYNATISKRGIRKKSQISKYIKGFKMFDAVRYRKKAYIIFGRRLTGFFHIQTLDGEVANKGSVSYKKLKLLMRQSGFVVEQRKGEALPLLAEVTSLCAQRL